MSDNGKAALAAAIILAVFGFGAFFLPNVMLATGEASPIAAGVVAIAFVAAFFLVFWLRGRSRGNKDE